ncbi:MAG: hypothetical protein AAB011_12235 [Candidatus Eisenbacteria bacterium]
MAFDTTPEAARIQADVLRGLGANRRLVIACRMSEAVRSMALARLRAQHPGLDPAAIRGLLIFELYGIRRSAG